MLYIVADGGACGTVLLDDFKSEGYRCRVNDYSDDIEHGS